jgi:hypothetical protein
MEDMQTEATPAEASEKEETTAEAREEKATEQDAKQAERKDIDCNAPAAECWRACSGKYETTCQLFNTDDQTLNVSY